MSDYNYAVFPEDLEMESFQAFRDAVRVGERAPDGDVTDVATAETLSLSSLWKDAALLIEFGSIS